MSENVRPRLLLIDGHSMAYRAFFALPADKFATSTGQPTNAVYGFISMLINLLKEEEPTHIAVAFDIGRTTFRTALFPEYKATRDASPEAFRGQVPLIREVLSALNVVSIDKEDFEADDIVATLSSRGVAAGFDVLVCSGDRDTFQLITETSTVLYPIKGVSELARMTPDAVTNKYGVTPGQYPDIAALVGETSDNLPGVPGVGPKTAAKWINAYGSLDELLAQADGVKGKVGESLRAHLETVAQNRRLNALVRDLELGVELGDLERRDWLRQDVDQLFDVLQFRSLRDRLYKAFPEQGGQAIEEVPVELHLDELAAGELASWLDAHGQGSVGIDVEGSAAKGGGEAWRVSLASDDRHGVSIDLADIRPADENALAAFLADLSRPKLVHDSKFIWHALHGRGLEISGVSFDTSLAAYLCFPDQRSYDLADLTVRHLHRELTGSEGAKATQDTLSLDATEDAMRSTERAMAVLDLAKVLETELVDRSATHLLTELELPLVPVLARMEQVGIGVDGEYLNGLERDFGAVVEQAASDAYAQIGREVNLGSPKQLQEVLFDQLEMPKTKKIKTGYTTDAESLAELFVKTGHPFLEHLLAHRDASKLRQIVEGLRRSVAADGRIHTTFQQTIAATGRLSSTDPNLQNIPTRSDEGRRIRQAFVVGDTFDCLLTADYSQIEMRIMAHLSEDESLIEAFQSGEDLHNYVGSKVFGVPADEVSAAMRSKVKAMSYGLAYGLSAFGLSRQLGVAPDEARGLMNDYFERFGGVRDYLAGVVDKARETGYTETILGRRRYLPDLTSDNRQRREMAERMALNAPIQGSAADLVKVAMLGVDRELRAADLDSKLLLQIHDEVIIEVSPGERERVEAIVRHQMGSVAQLKVPLDVSVGTGHSWLEAAH